MSSTSPITLYRIIKDKINKHAEIIVILFEHCNLRCSMCPQDHETLENTSRENILSKTGYIIDWINNNDTTNYFKLHIMGGEVFENYFLEKSYLEIYQEFIDKIKLGVVDKEKEIVFNFVTNLVFDHSDLVLEFLEKNNLMISTSYDTVGRFSPKNLLSFKKNIEKFKNKISMISCVMTAPSMRSVTKGDSYFDYLYQNFTIDWDSLWPTQDTKTNKFLMPKESETLEFYKCLIDKYPKCLNVEHFVSKKPVMKMTCTRGNNTTILQDNSIPVGCSGTSYIKDRKTSDEDITKVMTNFFEKYNCFQCEYFQKCPFTCFIKKDYKFIEDDLNECVFKMTFKYVEEKKQTDTLS